ncbi:MAG: VOC family protein [Propionibacteriaceae bacterium]
MTWVYLENLVLDALCPGRLGQFWASALAADVLTDTEDAYECRLRVDGGPDLDLCFPRVPDRPAEEIRLHLNLRGGADQEAVTDRLVGLGARRLDIGQAEVPLVVLADPEGNAFCVLEERPVYSATGPIAALPIDSANPETDGAFWSWLTGWTIAPGVAPVTLRHPSRHGVLLEFCAEQTPKTAAKNRLHLDVRLEAGDDPDDVLAGVASRSGRRLEPGWGELPWWVCADPSGNEFCLLPSRPAS